MRVVAWDDAFEDAKKRVGREFTMVAVPDSPSEKELSDYARKQMSRMVDFDTYQARVSIGANILRRLIDDLPGVEYALVIECLNDIAGDDLVNEVLYLP